MNTEEISRTAAAAEESEKEEQKRMEKEKVEEERVTIRDFSRDDLEDFTKWAMDEAVTRFTSWYAYESVESVAKYMEDQVFGREFYKAICVDGRAVGAISMCRGEGDMDRCRAEVGYVIASQWWGRSVASHALRKGVALAFVLMPDVHRIEALIEPANVGSWRAVEKCGFTKEGLLLSYCIVKGTTRDMFIYRFLRSDLNLLTNTTTATL